MPLPWPASEARFHRLRVATGPLRRFRLPADLQLNRRYSVYILARTTDEVT